MQDFSDSNAFNRRQFLRAGVVGLAATAAVDQTGLLMAKTPSYPLGLDLFTLREDTQKDFAGTLKKVKEIGFKTVEICQTYDLKGAEIRKMVEDAGLTTPSWHGGAQHIFTNKTFADVKDHWEKNIEYAHELGVHYLSGNIWDADPAKGLDEYKRAVDVMNPVGELLKKAGLQFLYHNLNACFQVFDGVVPYDWVLAHTDKDLVQLQIEGYWMARACVDPVVYYKKYPGRSASIHIKDKKKSYTTPTYVLDKPDPFTELGNGATDWKHVLEAAPAGGLKYPFIEQDFTERASMFESVKIDFDYLKKLPLKNLSLVTA